jgi:flagellar L-ring protein precursor FlgH
MRRDVIFLMGWAMVAVASADLVSRMYVDRTARQVGDLVTIEIVEESSVQKNASDDRDKSASGSVEFELPAPQFGGKSMWQALTLPEWSHSASKAYSSSGSKSATDAFSTSITVHITEVLPNGNLMISGDRMVNIDGDILRFMLSGMIRQDDIDLSNTVQSTKIAGAAINYETVGEFSKSQRKGLFTRVLDWVIPF